MRLPIERTERGEVVRRRVSSPRKAVPAVHLPCSALTQGTVWVMNASLQNCAEYRVAAQTESCCHTENKRRKNLPGEFAYDALSDKSCKGAVRSRNKRARKADAFRIVGVEERWMGAALVYMRQLPAEVHRIANSGIHSLTAGGAVDVTGIAGEEGPTHTEFVSH